MPEPPSKVALPRSSSGVTSVPLARGAFGDRLRAFAKGLFLIDVGFVILVHGALALEPGTGGRIPLGQWVEEVSELTLWGLAWLVLGRVKLGERLLRWTEVGLVLASGCLYASWVTVHSLGAVGVYEMLLSCVAVYLFRALLVPSSPRRTFTLTVIGCLPGLLAVAFSRASEGLGVSRATLLVITVSWLAVATGFATIATSVIHALRRDVHDAKKLGQYTLLELLGEGGMGAVYRARHALLRRPTALKLLHPDRTSPGAVARFEREVQLTSELAHPNIVSVYDFGRAEDGRFYYVMEYLDGVDLDRLVAATGPMVPARVRHVLAQVVLALDEAHARGLVHRDVKPANVILCPSRGGHDVAKVCDFGLVKDVSGGSDGHRTEERQLLGTPLYMSPEAVATGEVDHRGDLYSVGAMAYQLLTGTPPFRGPTVIEICSQHLHTEPEPPSKRLGRALPASLEAIVLRCLAKTPEARFPSARSLLEALDACDDIPWWTPADAAAWWATSGAELQRRDEAAVSTMDLGVANTLAVDAASRA